MASVNSLWVEKRPKKLSEEIKIYVLWQIRFISTENRGDNERITQVSLMQTDHR